MGLFMYTSALLVLATVPALYIFWLLTLVLSLFLGTSWCMKVDEMIWDYFQKVCLFFYENLGTQKIVFHGDFDVLTKAPENVLYISNHQTDMDWLMCDAIIARQGRIGRLRYVLKEVLKYVPVFGHYFLNHGCIYVNRGNFKENRAIRSLEFLKKYKLPSWLVIFPEGTRIDLENKTFMDRSAEYAKKQGLQPLRCHGTPRSRGVELILQHMSDYLTAVYDVTIFYEDCVNPQKNFARTAVPNLFTWFDKPRVVHIHIQRVDMSLVPKSGAELQRWLHDRFAIKDNLFDEFIASMRSSQGATGKPEAGKAFLSSVPHREWPLHWARNAFPFGVGLLVNIAVYGSIPYGGWAFVLTWVVGTLIGWIVVCTS